MPEPDVEIGAAEIGKYQPLAHPQRRVRELFHLRLLRRHRGALLPEPAERQRVGSLLRHEHRDLRDHGLTLEHRLRRGAPVVGMPLRHYGVEFDVLILQCVHQLVRDHDAQLIRLDIGGDVEGVGIGVIVTGDLLGEHVDHGRSQLQRIGNQSE